MIKLLFHKKFSNKFRKLEKDERIRIHKRLLLLEKFPFIALDIKKLKGYKNTYRLRVGDYRIKFVLKGDTLIFYDIELRGKAYKR